MWPPQVVHPQQDHHLGSVVDCLGQQGMDSNALTRRMRCPGPWNLKGRQMNSRDRSMAVPMQDKLISSPGQATKEVAEYAWLARWCAPGHWKPWVSCNECTNWPRHQCTYDRTVPLARGDVDPPQEDNSTQQQQDNNAFSNLGSVYGCHEGKDWGTPELWCDCHWFGHGGTAQNNQRSSI